MGGGSSKAPVKVSGVAVSAGKRGGGSSITDLMTRRTASVKSVGELKQESGEAVWWKPIPDQFSTIDEVTWALRDHGLESSNLIIGIDFTKVRRHCVASFCVDFF